MAGKKKSDRHGHHKNNSRLYRIWCSMRQRCTNPNSVNYHNYGGRGIKICDEWQTFHHFLLWALANGYQDHLQIDRVNNNGDYCPENCRWVIRKTNLRNKRTSRLLTANGTTKCAAEWSETLGIGKTTIQGWYDNHGVEYAEQRITGLLDGTRSINQRNRQLKVNNITMTANKWSKFLGGSKHRVKNWVSSGGIEYAVMRIQKELTNLTKER